MSCLFPFVLFSLSLNDCRGKRICGNWPLVGEGGLLGGNNWLTRYTCRWRT